MQFLKGVESEPPDTFSSQIFTQSPTEQVSNLQLPGSCINQIGKQTWEDPPIRPFEGGY